MGKRRGIIITLLVLVLILTAAASAFAASTGFTDLGTQNNDYPYVKFMVDKGIIKGYPGNLFKPQGNITRAEMAVLMVKAGSYQTTASQAGKSAFKDVSKSHWAYSYIETAAKSGLIKGYNGYYKPEAPISRAEASTLILRLTKEAKPSINLPAAVKDVKTSYWAANDIAVALDAGIFMLADKNQFKPEAPAKRLEVAKGLAIMLNLAPEKSLVSMSGKLIPKKGEVLLNNKKIDKEAICSAGSVIKTGKDAQAELKFSDGSALLIEQNAELTVKQARAQTTILKDGSAGEMVDFLQIGITQGKIYGALSSAITREDTDKQANSGLMAKLAALTMPVFAANAQQQAWYKNPYEKKVRVQVDMPWGVAAVRGTIWANAVSATGQSTSVVDGSVAVSSSGGLSVSVGAGQATTLTSAAAPPTAPAPMPPAEQQAWAQQLSWVEQTVTEMVQNAPVIVSPPAIQAPAEQPTQQQQQQQQQQTTTPTDAIRQIVNTVRGSIGASTTTSTTTSGSSGGSHGNNSVITDYSVSALDNAVTITFPAAVGSVQMYRISDWYPVVTLQDGTKIKIGITNGTAENSVCLHNAYITGTNTVKVTTVGGQANTSYNLALKKGTDYSELVTSKSFTYSFSGQNFIEDIWTPDEDQATGDMAYVYFHSYITPDTLSASDFTFDNGVTINSVATSGEQSGYSFVLNTSTLNEGTKYKLSYKGSYTGLDLIMYSSSEIIERAIWSMKSATNASKPIVASTTLPTNWDGIGISWASNKPEYITINSSNGNAQAVVTRPTGADNVEVELTATFTLRNSTITKIFPITVLSAQKGFVGGTIYNAQNQAGVSGVTINLRSGSNVQSGNIVATTTTDSGGGYSFILTAGTYTAEIVAPSTDYITSYFTVVCDTQTANYAQNGVLSKVVPAGQTRIILTWGQNPRDLDAHLVAVSDQFEVFFDNDKYTDSQGNVLVELDVDDTSSYGPETITVYPGLNTQCTYFVRKFSGDGTLAASGARVEVYQGSQLVGSYTVPTTLTGTDWFVFTLNGTTITPVSASTEKSIATIGLPYHSIGSTVEVLIDDTSLTAPPVVTILSNLTGDTTTADTIMVDGEYVANIILTTGNTVNGAIHTQPGDTVVFRYLGSDGVTQSTTINVTTGNLSAPLTGLTITGAVNFVFDPNSHECPVTIANSTDSIGITPVYSPGSSTGTVEIIDNLGSWHPVTSGDTLTISDLRNGDFDITILARETSPESKQPTIYTLNFAPFIQNVTVNLNASGDTITASYTWFDIEGDTEANPQIQWYRASNADGSDKVAIADASSTMYIPTAADYNKYLFVGITPRASQGTENGLETFGNIYFSPIES